MSSKRTKSTGRARWIGFHGVLLAAMLVTTFFPVTGVSASSTSTGLDTSVSLISGEGGVVSMNAPWQGRETPTSPAPPPRETPTSPPPPPRYTPTNTTAPRSHTPTPTQPSRIIPSTPTPTSSPAILVQLHEPLTLRIIGCTIPAANLRVEFKALNLTLGGDDQLLFEHLKLQLQNPGNDPQTQADLLDALSKLLQTDPDEEEIAALPAVQVPVEGNPGQPGFFKFIPPEVDPNALYQLTPVFLADDCGFGGPGPVKTLASYWFPGVRFERVFVPPRLSTLAILGCDPRAEEVKLTFRRIYRDIQASGEKIRVPVQPGGAPGLFVFDPPPAKPGDIFALDLHLNSPDCPTGEEIGIDNWTPGSSIHTTFALPGGASLLASSLGKTIPGAQMGEVFAGGVWTTDIEFSTSPKGNYQTFKWETMLPNIQGGKLQASLMPFPSKTEGDLFSPPGLVVEWDVTCVNCTFTVDVSSLAIEPPAGSQSQPAKQNFLQLAWQAAGKVFNQLLAWVKSIFTKQTPEAPGAPIMTGASQQPGNFVNLVDTGKIVPPLITTYYFRIIPVYNQQAAGSASNPVRIQWYGEDPLADVIKKGQECQQNPSAPGCPTPVPPPLKPFIVEITGYHGIVAPKNGHVGCYLVTKDTTVNIGGVPASYKAGDKFCPPKPKSKSWYEAVVDFVVDAVNWVSTAYNDLKDTVISIVANFVPDVICNKDCLGTLLDAGLMALGIPPSIPNFDQLMNEGLQYLASQAAAQLNIPPEVTDAIKPGDFLTDAAFDLAVSEAEAAWRAEAEKQIKQGLQQGLEAAQYALSSSVSWIPDGVPVKPDPFGDYQPPTMMLKVTRDPTVPLEADVCSGQPGQKGKLFIDTTVVVSAEHAQNFNDWISSTKQKMKADYAYYLYESMYVPLPQLGLGETQLVPVVLKPTINNYWGSPWTSYNDAQSAWSTWYWNGEMDLWVYNPCSNSATILGDPNQSFGQ